MAKLSDSEVNELIIIADAKIKEWKGSWYTLFIPIPKRYNLEEQLEAIEKLGNSENERALAYISSLLKISSSYDEYLAISHYCHINLKGNLKRKLDRSINSISRFGYNETTQKIKSAISKLEESLSINKNI